jgi:hypothetical protein
LKSGQTLWLAPDAEDLPYSDKIAWHSDRQRSPQHIRATNQILGRLVGEKLAELVELLARRLHFDASIIVCLSVKSNGLVFALLVVWSCHCWENQDWNRQIEKCAENAFALYRDKKMKVFFIEGTKNFSRYIETKF